jgi:hypothetical protein
MTARPPALRERIEEVEARVLQRQQRVHSRWRDTQDATRALVQVRRTLPLVAAGAAVVAALVLLRRARAPAKTGGLLGALAAAGLTLMGPRYGTLYSLILQLLNRRSGSAHGR